MELEECQQGEGDTLKIKSAEWITDSGSLLWIGKNCYLRAGRAATDSWLNPGPRAWGHLYLLSLLAGEAYLIYILKWAKNIEKSSAISGNKGIGSGIGIAIEKKLIVK